jgi:lysophospholipase L1-like esterase
LAALSLTETADDANSWSRTSSFNHINSSNRTLFNQTGNTQAAGIIHIGAGYKRPGYELPLANGIPLRILAIGASTTRGDESFDNNGFRRPIREHLTSIGNLVNFVGTQRVGNMSDNDIEAYPGARTGEMHHHAEVVVPQTKPNLFLVNVGSNDCFQDYDIPNFYKRYYSFIDYLLTASPRATVIMGTLLPTTETARFNASERVVVVNQQLRRLYEIFKSENKPVVLAEMNGLHDLAWDGMHPTSASYDIMAKIMLDSIIEADARGFLRPAEPVHGIIQDGDLERQDEAYGKWVQQKRLMELEAKKAETEAIRAMNDGLKAWTLELKKNEAGTVPARLRRHLS